MSRAKKFDGPTSELQKKTSTTGTYQVAFEKIDEELERVEKMKEKAKDIKESARQTISGIFKPETA